MLVEGGYLDSMKRIIEKAAQTPEPSGEKRPSTPLRTGPHNNPSHQSSSSGVVSRSLKKLTTILFGRS